MSEYYNKIHFEIVEDASIMVHQYNDLPKIPFYKIIDSIDKKFEGRYTAFPCDDACYAYVEAIFEKIKEYFQNSNPRSRFWDTYLPYMFYKSGKKVFRPTPDLVHMLIDTELRNIDTFFVQSPFRCIFISIPKEVKLMNPYNIPVDGLYIAVFNKDEIHYKGFSEEYHKYEQYENSKNIVISAVSDILLAPEDPRETMYYWNIALKDGNLFDQISIILDTYDKRPANNDNYSRVFLENLLSFSINSLLYINSKDSSELIKTNIPQHPDIKNKAKIRQAFKRTQIPFYTLGKNITIDHSYKNVINLYDREKQSQRKLIGKWVVRGHWRNQPHGKESKERKLIWIQPFVKGEEFAEVIEKGYVVK